MYCLFQAGSLLLNFSSIPSHTLTKLCREPSRRPRYLLMDFMMIRENHTVIFCWYWVGLSFFSSAGSPCLARKPEWERNVRKCGGQLSFASFGRCGMWRERNRVTFDNEEARRAQVGKKSKKVWREAPLCHFWTVWRERNRVTFDN